VPFQTTFAFIVKKILPHTKSFRSIAFGILEEEDVNRPYLENAKFSYKETYQCEECETQCVSLQDWESQTRAYREAHQFQCDICPFYFEKYIDWQFHKRGCHWDQM
jgi:predicted methyltransferase